MLAPHKHVHGSSRQAAELTRGACLCRTLSTLTLDVDLRGEVHRRSSGEEMQRSNPAHGHPTAAWREPACNRHPSEEHALIP